MLIPKRIYVGIFVAVGVLSHNGAIKGQESQGTATAAAPTTSASEPPANTTAKPAAVDNAPAEPTSTAAANDSSTAVHPAATTASTPKLAIADGSRIEDPGKNFSIVPPLGWEVQMDVKGVSLVMHTLAQPGVYQRTIQVRHGKEVYTTNRQSATEAVKIIVAKRAASSGVIQDYTLENQQFINLEDGTEAITFNTRFHIDDVKMNEMHLLVGDANGHFLVTYTDVAKNFESEKKRQYVDEAYKSMISIKPTHPSSAQFSLFFYIGVGLCAVILLILLASIYRKYRMRKLLGYDSTPEPEAASLTDQEPLTNDNVELSEHLLAFITRVIQLLDHLPQTLAGHKIADQLIRATMAVGANYEESMGTDNVADLSHSLRLALKEMRESRYWLALLVKANMVTPDKIGDLLDQATLLRDILGQSVATSGGKSHAKKMNANPS